ncbi:SCO7613 C-terminal domain-containing membrane protein [Nocardioides currus]|uniref:DUF2157 domain-containing protein n=1 Tax=Nocardioides currus TaxID=2133958 RepID=A0A2R7YUU6_9ACTN|nr:hypothetical protein [Nocardioides currus]PUA80073.1 hypothetical protein C7S10_16115 [Nocardioides currus]
MFTYADQRACPGCRADLDDPALSCSACGLSLTGPAPLQVFRALQQVDRLVSDLYAAGRAPQTISVLDRPARSTYVPPQHQPVGPARPGLSAASVPRILLGLGALCLLVAALVFLAVAWAALGVDGRTVVLVLFTAVAGALTVVVARRDLRAGAEALGSVTLGLFALDLGGAWNAGWLGDLGDPAFLVLAGLLVAAAGMAVARWATTTPVATLTSAEVIAAIALGTSAVFVNDLIDRGEAVGAVAALVVLGLGAAAGHALAQQVLAVVASGGAAIAWLMLVAIGVVRVDELSIAHLWGDLAVWPLLVATLLVAAAAGIGAVPHELRVVAAATAVFLGTLVVTAPVFDESPTQLALVELGVVLGFGVLATRLPGDWRWVCAAPSVVAALGLSVSVVRLLVVAVGELVLHEPWSVGVLDRLDAPDVPWTWPLLLPAGVIGVVGTVATLALCAGREPRRLVVPGASALLVAVALVPSVYAVPLVVAVSALVVAAAVLAAAGAWLGRRDLLAVAAGVFALAQVAGLASDWITLVLLALLTAATVALELRGRAVAEELAGLGALLAPVSAAGLVWTAGHLAGLDIAVRALPVLLVLGVAIVAMPRLEREAGAAVGAALAVGGSVFSTGTLDQTWLAIDLTTAGVAATASALLHPARRHLGWVGLALLTLAQWIRLQQVGVETVEAYTLPLAVVLLVVGTVALLRGHESSITTLAPGLGLALVPSLLLVLVDPVSLRAVLLGLACVVLVAVGLTRGWAAPLVAGAGVGALVVLREATYAQVLPQWMMIGLVGLALTVVGVTWEQRLQEIRRVSSYVRGLR